MTLPNRDICDPKNIVPLFFCKLSRDKLAWVFHCPYCRRNHRHCPEEGPRVAHCDMKSPYYETGYYLKKIEER